MNQIQILDPIQAKRPPVITIICIMGFVGVALSIPMIFSEIASQIGAWFAPYAGVVAAINLVCMIGLWKSKKWSFNLYVRLVLVNQVVLLVKDQWHPVVLIIQLITILIASHYLHSRTRVIFAGLVIYVKKQIWAIIVAYMLGLHNVYREEQKNEDDIVFTIENIEEQENGDPK
ncbi:MAG: hypothetical protein CMB80_21550 [Flammeovirgaceae bacterium]|nr:hypothetical protein [Flammeovirgaceae bacterium]|tara:strand:+ start:2211 stop:2732 length:522 start_codon:yes stop_codon:yes gene_type:complete